MTQTPVLAPATTTTCHPATDRRRALLTTGLAGLAYLLWRAGGVDPAVRSGNGSFHIGLVSVLVTAAVVSVAGLGLLRFLEKRQVNGLRTWTVIASLVWLFSFLGPLGAVDLTSGLALVNLHLVVGAAVVVGARRSRQCGVA
jgi:hypothetical protein